MNNLAYLLQAPAGTPGGGYMQFLFIIILIAIFYLFFIRPQQKRQKQLQKEREALKTGDKVITSGGIYGTIKEINTNTKVVTLEVWDGVKIKVDMNSVFASPQSKDQQ